MLRVTTIALLLTGMVGQAAERIGLPACYVENRFKFSKTDCYPQIEAAVLKAAQGSAQGQLLEWQTSFFQKNGYKFVKQSVLVKIKTFNEELESVDSYLDLDGQKLPSLGVFYLQDGEILIKNVYGKDVVVSSGVTENHRVHVLVRVSYKVFRGPGNQPPEYIFRILNTKVIETVMSPRIGASSSGGGHH